MVADARADDRATLPTAIMTREDRSEILTALGHAIRRRRVSAGWSQDRFAELVGFDRTYVGSVERGERNVSLVNLARFASALGIRTSELLTLMEQELVDAGTNEG